MIFHIVTLFPESFHSYLSSSMMKRAVEKGLVDFKYYNPRHFAVVGKNSEEMTYSERRVDDRPYGGGPGMVIEALPVIGAIEQAIAETKKGINKSKKKIKIVFFSPSGKQFTNKTADLYKKYDHIILIAGHYEGIDERIKKVFPMADISIGPYTLTGGELPAMVTIDAITRRIEGVLGDRDSIEEDRIASPMVYTRPEIIEYKGKKYRVPKVLLGGNHAKIDEWKKKKQGKNTV